MSVLSALLALVVAAMYAYIAVAVIPLLARAAGPGRPLITLAKWGAVTFLAGCSVTHVSLAVSAYREGVGGGDGGMPGMAGGASTLDVLLWHVAPHLAQIAGGFAFAVIARRRLEVTVLSRDEAEQLAERARQLQTAFELAPLGMALSAAAGPDEGRLLQVNPALGRMLGREDGSMVGHGYLDFVHPADRRTSAVSRAALLGGDAVTELDQRLMHRDGRDVWTHTVRRIVRDESGAPLHVLSQIRDITEELRREAELRHLADHDALTGILNRRRFSEELDRAVELSRRHGEEAAILVVDLDQFKYVNDTYGHAVGDQLLASVAEVLRRRLRSTDVLARLGGDEFGVLCPHTSAADVRLLADTLLASIHRDAVVVAEGRTVHTAASIGITFLRPGAEVSGDQVLADADLAMYEAKESGRDRVTVMDHGTALASVRARLAWSERVRDSLAHGGFQLWEQPIVNVVTGEQERSELLLRMLDPRDGSVVEPGTFLPSAERYGQIHTLDRWVFGQAVRLLGERRRFGDRRPVEVNLSGASLTDEELIGDIIDLVAHAPIEPGQLVVEITETAAVRNIEVARRLARRLSDVGCQFALDDFGSGFGSFYYLKHLPLHGIKIDGEFVKDLPRSAGDRLTVEAIAMVAHGFGKDLTAEYVQDRQTFDILREIGVGYAQGFYVGQPRPVAELQPQTLGLDLGDALA